MSLSVKTENRPLCYLGMVHTCVDVTGTDVKIGDHAIIQINPLIQKGMRILYR